MRNSNVKTAAGFALLDALIGMLIFSIGVLGLVGAQTAAMRTGGESQLRLEASQHAASVISAIRVADPANVSTLFASPTGAGYTAWCRRVTGVDCQSGAADPSILTFLPGAADDRPTVAFAGKDVTVTVSWRAGGTGDLHRVTLNATID